MNNMAADFNNDMQTNEGTSVATLALDRIEHGYGSNDSYLSILKNASFSLFAGEMVALTAQSGAGKSTILHIAGLLERPQSGDVLIEGKSTHSQTNNQRTAIRRSTIGFVYQFHHLLPEFTARENLMIPQMINGLSKSNAAERTDELLHYMRLEHRGTHLPTELSGGEQQRIAIARAVANAPAILLADEPTGNLDPETSDYVFEALQSLVRASGLSTLIATHNIELARKMDRRITIKDGEIVEL